MQQVMKKAAGMHTSPRVPTAGEGIHHCKHGTHLAVFMDLVVEKDTYRTESICYCPMVHTGDQSSGLNSGPVVLHQRCTSNYNVG